MAIEWLEGGITAVPGIMASGIPGGIKPDGKRDMALIYSPAPAVAAGVFTTNAVKSGSVKVTAEHISGGHAQAILAVSGNANSCTGDQGIRDAREMARAVGDLLRLPANHVLVGTTGVIGQPLPMEKIRGALPRLVKTLSPQGGRNAAEGIMTTDTRPKEAAIRVAIGDQTVTIGGIAKGAAMIHPHMATMLCFLATDARVEHPALQRALRVAVDRSFNRITVDGDRSTNDTVLILANGLAENPPVGSGRRGARVFQDALGALTGQLARMIIEDAEGATKFITVTVRGARTRRDAQRVAYAVATSTLVKTALYGQDPNWGRILAAVGATGARLEEERIRLLFGDEGVVSGGVLAAPVRWERIKEHLAQREVTLTVDLGLGNATAEVWTSDLTEEYVRLNSKYTT